MPILLYIILGVLVLVGAAIGAGLIGLIFRFDSDDEKVESIFGVVAIALAFVAWTYRKDVYIWYSAEPGVNFSDSDFSRVNFRKVCLIEANLERAKLSGADFQYAQLNNAKLAGADLIGANLTGTIMFGADLKGADLRNANMEAVDLREADLSGAKMSGANLTNAWMWGAKGASLEGTWGKPRDELDLHPELKNRRFDPTEKPVLDQSPKKRKIDEVEDALGFWVGEWALTLNPLDSLRTNSEEGDSVRLVARWINRGGVRLVRARIFSESDGREIGLHEHEYDSVQGIHITRWKSSRSSTIYVFHSRYNSTTRTFNGDLVLPWHLKWTRTFNVVGRDKFSYKIKVVRGGPFEPGMVIEGVGVRHQERPRPAKRFASAVSPGQQFISLGESLHGYPEYRHKKTGIEFVALPGGQSSMGSPPSREPTLPEETLHSVTLSPFLIAKYEVTQAQWKKIMGNNPSHFRGDARPVENISRTDAQKYLTVSGLALPTEAQWEYACRAGVSGLFSGGGWFDNISKGTTHPVGQTEPNEFGLFDMQGNVEEICRDVYDRDFYSKPEARGRDPVNLYGAKRPNAQYVVRGGHYSSELMKSRCAYRSSLRFPANGQGRTDANRFTGFRSVYDLR